MKLKIKLSKPVPDKPVATSAYDGRDGGHDTPLEAPQDMHAAFQVCTLRSGFEHTHVHLQRTDAQIGKCSAPLRRTLCWKGYQQRCCGQSCSKPHLRRQRWAC